jgi:hypothetical protein
MLFVLATAWLCGADRARAESADDPLTLAELGPRARLPLRLVERPLTMPRSLFEIFGGAELGMLGERGAARLVLGARYGVDDDLEVGLRLLRAVLSPQPGTGLGAPSGWVRARLVSRAALQLAIAAEVSLPGVGERFEAQLELSSLGRIGRALRVELAARAGLVAERGAARGALEVPLVARVQLGPAVSLGLGATAWLPQLGARDALLRPRVQLTCAFADRERPEVELAAELSTTAIAFAGAAPAGALESGLLGMVTLSFFTASRDPRTARIGEW